jgi:hypothetical protein
VNLTSMPELSPTAQAVLDAMYEVNMDFDGENATLAAAALEAAADQVVPEEPLHGGDQRWMFERDARQACRKKLLAIAAELNGDSNV